MQAPAGTQEIHADLRLFHQALLSIGSAGSLPTALQATVQAAVELTNAAEGEFVSARESSSRFLRQRGDSGLTIKIAGKTTCDGSPRADGAAEIERPLRSRAAAYGLLRLRAFPGAAFSDEAINLLEMLLAQAALILEHSHRFDQLEHAKREWEQIFDGMVDGVYICSVDGIIQRVNRALADMLGLSIAEILGHRREELHEELPDYQVMIPWHTVEPSPAHLDLQQTEFRCGTPERVFIETSFVLHTSSGDEMSVDPNDAPHRVCILRDITEQRRLQEQLLQSEKLAALGELVTGVAHELNNPLTTVVGYAQLMQGDSNMPPKVDRQMQKIHQEAVRASHIVQNLLAFARRSEPHKSWLDVNSELGTLVRMRDYQLQADNVKVVCHYDKDLPRIWGDPHQLQQVYLNIINNAAQAMVEWRGGGEIVITTEPVMLQREELVPGVRITFADNGPGIAPDHLRKVFDPFFTTKNVGQGTGLGMSISLGIISNHNGRIWAESRLGHGARFMLELPAVVDDTVVIEEEAPTLTPPPPGPQSHILVIDDEEPVVTLITEILALDGHWVTPAFNGAEALALLEAHDVDLILSDVRMPAVGGPTFFEILQTTRPDLLKRVIFVTGDTVSQSTQQFLQKTGCPVLAKPFDPERLRGLVNETLLKIHESTVE